MKTIIITGDTGTGKSTLAKMLLQTGPSRIKLFDGFVHSETGYTLGELDAMTACECFIVDHFCKLDQQGSHLLNGLLIHRYHHGLKTILIEQSVQALRFSDLPAITAILVDHKTVSIGLIKNTDLDEMVDVLCDILYKKKSSKLESGIELGFDAIIGLLLLVALWLYLFNPSEHYWLVGISIGVLTGEWLYRLFRVFFPKYMRRVY